MASSDMQSIFRLPWCTDNIGPKAVEKPGFDHLTASPVVEMSTLKRVKRKRDDDLAEAHLPTAHCNPRSKKPRLGNVDSPATDTSQTTCTPAAANKVAADLETQACSSSAMQGNADFSSDVAMADATQSFGTLSDRRAKLGQAIENQLNMQILLKHNELRLIDQEMAKCQVALEQLRRCELRPYPGSRSLDSALSTGLGPAISPPPGFSTPPHAAPHGVVDGPYTRHYARWLLEDSEFDSRPVFAPASVDSGASAANRSTRNGGVARKSVTSFTYTTPGRVADRLAGAPTYPPPSAKRDKSAPLVLRRSSDGKMVKLVCNNCNRGDMSSIQGFLNHCRIAHKVVYDSHDAAAVDCGRVMDEDEIANLPAESHAVPAPKPAAKMTPSRAPSLVLTTSVAQYHVHPLNTAQAASHPTTATPPLATSVVPAPSLAAPRPSHLATSPFKPSSALPKLSALFAKKNVGGDLEQATANARQKIDLGLDEPVLSPDACTPDSASPVAPCGQGRGPGALAAAEQTTRPLSRKGYRQPAQGPRPSSLASTAVGSTHRPEMPESPQELSTNVSPHTADSNPGLVSDVDDDDTGSASEEEAAAPHQSLNRSLNTGRDCAENMDLAVTVEDDIDEHGVVIRRNSMLVAEERGLRTVGGPSRKLGGGKRV